MFNIFILHQTTTSYIQEYPTTCCLISLFYIKPQLGGLFGFLGSSCLISLFYIKPQLLSDTASLTMCCLISLFYIKPQHGSIIVINRCCCLISLFYIKPQPILARPCRTWLFNIFILHQTTTTAWWVFRVNSCLISLFYIKPQLGTRKRIQFSCCLISLFYIKPQLVTQQLDNISVV